MIQNLQSGNFVCFVPLYTTIYLILKFGYDYMKHKFNIKYGNFQNKIVKLIITIFEFNKKLAKRIIQLMNRFKICIKLIHPRLELKEHKRATIDILTEILSQVTNIK